MSGAAAGALVIVGSSYAGVQLAASAREYGFEERIVLLGDEPHLPYQRPPLSKGLLTGKTRLDQLALRSAEFYEENRIDLLLRERAIAVDPAARLVTLQGGQRLAYSWLALTTGARCQALSIPGAALANVLQLRTLDDAIGILHAAPSCRHACVVGGGFIGLEVAAALRTAGCEVTVIEAQAHLLGRSVAPAMSAFVEASHRSRGVACLTGQAVAAFHGEQGRIAAVELRSGQRIACDLVVLGVGVVPNCELARDAGIAVANGIVVDALGRTSAPTVLAAGDVASIAMPAWTGHSNPVRLESIQAANEGAKAAASVVVGRNQPSTAIPWFWSDQFDLKFQMAGLFRPGDTQAVRGDIASGRFTHFFLRAGVVVAAHSVNRPAEHMQSRKLIAAKARLTPEQLSDPAFDLKFDDAGSRRT